MPMKFYHINGAELTVVIYPDDPAVDSGECCNCGRDLNGSDSVHCPELKLDACDYHCLTKYLELDDVH
jgi:hypothetical protein